MEGTTLHAILAPTKKAEPKKPAAPAKLEGAAEPAPVPHAPVSHA
jgi:translation initiation factor IF-3